jgi:hypothetical protein
MKKFVICTNHSCLRLSESHVNWLRANGHPDADEYFGAEDRSDPDLIACIEAVRAANQHKVDKAESLRAYHNQLRQDNDYAYVELYTEIDKLLAMLEYRHYQKHRIIAEMRKAIETNDWYNVTIYASPKNGISAQSVKEQLMEVAKTMHKYEPQFNAVNQAMDDFQTYCEICGLSIQVGGKVGVADGFEIKSYDETRFTAAVGDGGYDANYEHMELKPFLARETVATFVEAGDTDGLMDFLKSLNIGGFMDIRDDRTANVAEANKVTMSHELQAEFDAILASLAN